MSVTALEPVTSLSLSSTEVRPAAYRPVGKRTTTLRCLVVSEDQVRLELLAAAASDAGFEPIVCSDAASAWMLSKRDELHLAFVDLASVSDETAAKDLGEHLSRDRKLLVAVCGAEDEPLQEIWARKIGAWLYLPGIGDRQGLSELCAEARPVVERMSNR